MSKKVEIDRYREIARKAKEKSEQLYLLASSPEEKEAAANDWAEYLGIVDSEEKKIFVANMLIPDSDFLSVYLRNGRNARKTAEYYQVPQGVVVLRAASLELYEKEDEKNSQEEINERISNYDFERKIIDKETSDRTTDAISKITQLLELNNSRGDIIAEQEKTLSNKDEEIVMLIEESSRKDNIIASLKQEIEEKDLVIESQKKYLEEKEREVKAYQDRIKELLPYKENYEQIIGFLDQKVENSLKNK